MNENLKKDFNLIIQTCKEIQLPIFLHAGTLLGAIRNNDFIDGDNDFDFGIFQQDIPNEKRELLIRKLYDCEKMEFKGYEAKCFQHFIERTEFGVRPYVIKFWSPNAHWNTDFWIFTKRENDYYHRGWAGYFYYPKELLDTLDEIDFLDFKVLVPHNPELFLENMYGKDWKIPKQMSMKNKGPNYCNWTKELKNEI